MVMRFQSLFFWNSRPDSARSFRSTITGSVSILVFLELAPGPFELSGILRRLESFNPCFSGTRARTYTRTSRGTATRCFNPCFSGTRARTLRVSQSATSSGCFNPCFSGTRARTSPVCGDDGISGVSILVFLELAPGP